jgi:hypothetical protein
MAEVAAAVEEAQARILDDLDVTELPAVTVMVWQDRAAFEKKYGANAQNVQGFIDSRAWAVHIFNDGRALGPRAVHEFTHLVSLARNRDVLNNPRWLWEAVAIYESKAPPPPDPVTLACISSTRIPALEELDAHPGNIYRIGHLLAEFIVMKWSKAALGELISRNGDVAGTLGASPEEFRRLWLEYVLGEYEIRNPSQYSENC